MTAEMNPDLIPNPDQPSPATLASFEARDYLRLADTYPPDSPEHIDLSQRARDAFGRVYQFSIDYVRGAAHRFSGTEDDHSDILQDAYYKAYKGLTRFEGRTEEGKLVQVETWLFRITINAAKTHFQRKGRYARVEQAFEDTWQQDEDPLDETITPEEATEKEILRERLQQALGRLPMRTRVVVVMRDVYDMTHEQIAEELGISVSASKVRLHRGRKKIKDDLYGDQALEE